MTVYSIGYEGLDFNEFAALLKKNKIKKLIDIRKNPISRKKGFSKSRMREGLELEGIDYHHFGDLGVPSAWRKKQKADLITRKKMFSDYVKKILPVETDAIEELTKVLKSRGRSALLCYEEDPSDCHRFYLLEKLKSQGPVKTSHIRRPLKKIKSFLK